jgi:hypothetical protein
MENLNKTVIISAGINGWYGQGVRRLERSLNFEGWGGSILTWKDEYPPGSYTHDHIPYYFKIAAFEEAIRQGYSHILWVDASMWAVKNPVKLFDLINEQGYYFFSSGYNLAQSVNDRALAAAGLPRDEAEGVTEWASGLVGINMDNPDGSTLYNQWKEYMDAGLSIGVKHQNKEESQDHRFLAHRQDQSCLSLAAWKLGLRSERGLDFVAYKNTGHNPKEVIFFIEGLA